mmetsp:Transcript_16145/g.19115  ORF Transcript_16145/g.19115 Transcript_16145/m.19115 type:complete len:255 (+) Transcript_16145:79-843(+)
MNQSFHSMPFSQTQPQVQQMSFPQAQPNAAEEQQKISPTTQIFGLIVPGRNVLTNFVPTDHTGTKFTLTLNFGCATDAESPLSVPDLVFFLLPSINLPERSGAVLYWSATSAHPISDGYGGGGNTSSSGFELLGALTPSKTSGVFRTGWASHEALLSLLQSSSASGIVVTLGVSIEPLENIANLSISEGGADDRKNVGKNIALDLYNFLQSFDDGGSARTAGWMTVPTNVFDRWYRRFETKIVRDPNFFMKNIG